MSRYSAYDKALSMVSSKTSSLAAFSAHVTVLCNGTVEVELPDVTYETRNALCDKYAMVFKAWIPNARFRVFTRKRSMLDDFFNKFCLPGEQSPLVPYGDGDF